VNIDHHRLLFTVVGTRAALERAVLALAERAIKAVDLRHHYGVHARVGALDVVPFVPLAGSTMTAAVSLAHRAGGLIAETFNVPVFFYGTAALWAVGELPVLPRQPRGPR
jgi:glutamate formiminotransferase